MEIPDLPDIENTWGIEFERGGRVRRIRKFIYKCGFRPKPGSILYSPSLTLFYTSLDGFKAAKKK